MFAPPLFGSCSHIGLAVFSRPPAGLHRPDSSDRFRAGSGPISAALGRASARILRVRSHPARPLAFCGILHVRSRPAPPECCA